VNNKTYKSYESRIQASTLMRVLLHMANSVHWAVKMCSCHYGRG